MKKLILSLAAVASVGTALPAAAQTWDHNRPAYDQNRPTYEQDRPAYSRYAPALNRAINQREAELRARIEVALQRHTISRAHALRLSDELRRIEVSERQYRRGGMNRREADFLNIRLDRVQAELQTVRHYDGRRW
jgi:hypothetical protein